MASSAAIKALVAAVSGPLACDFATDINPELAPLVEAALRCDDALSRPVREVLLAFGWDLQEARFLEGRPDLHAVACKMKHVLLEVRRAGDHDFSAHAGVMPPLFAARRARVQIVV